MKILISYRRADSAAIVGRIHDRFSARYGAKSLFLDIDNIPYGSDFRSEIRETMAVSDIFIAVVGPDWLGPRPEGASRMQDADDPVRVEIETAMQYRLPILPVLIGAAAMPAEAELPETIRSFAFLNAAHVDPGRDFHGHLDDLIKTTDRILAQKYGRPVAEPADGRTPPRRSQDLQRLALPLVCAVLLLGLAGVADLASFAPPWPKGVTIVAAIVALGAAATAYERLKTATRTSIARWMLAGGVVAAVAACGYLAGVSRYTYQQPGFHGLWAKGYQCTDDALRMFKDQCPELSMDELSDAEFREDRLWTSGSIATVQYILAILWLSVLGGLGLVVGGLFAQRTPLPT